MDDEREAMVMFAAVLEELQRIQATLATIAAGLLGKTTPHPPEPSPVIGSESHGPSARADEKKVSIEKNFPKKSETRPFSKEEAKILFGKAPLDTEALKVKMDYYASKVKMPEGWTFGGRVPFQTWKPDETPYYFPGLKLDLE